MQLFIDSQWCGGKQTQTLHDCYSEQPYAEIPVASSEQIDAAVAGVRKGFQNTKLTPIKRAEILFKAAEIIESRRESLQTQLRHEVGFPDVDSVNEINRCARTLALSAEEAKRILGELVPIQATPGPSPRFGYTIRVPKGVVCAITPFNSPLNTVAHKIAPALAAGNAVIVKPSEVAPGSTLALVQALLDAGLPPALISVVHGPGETVGQQLLEDPRIDYYTFTGSTAVGKKVRDAAGIRGTQLELGSIASTIICADADLEKAAKKLVSGCFRKAGQVCTSVQRLYVHRDVYQDFKETFLPMVESTPWGSPEQNETVVGPMIDLDNAKRVHSWIEEAVNAGASLLCGGRRHHNVVEPTVLEFVPTDARLFSQEVFGPVVSLVEYDDLEAAIDSANATPYGLAVGVFTNSLDLPFLLADRLHFGGIHINETSSSRLDVMPFGGVKDSGYGKEGPHYAIRDMTDEKLITIAY